MQGADEPPVSPPRPLTGGAVMSAASRIAVALTGAITTVFVARLLGPEGAGGFAIALTVVLMLTTATTLGVEHGVAYYVSSGRWSPRAALVASQRLAFGLGTLGALLAVGVRLLVPDAFGGLSVGDTAVASAALPFALSWFYVGYVALAVDRYEGFVVPPALQSSVGMVLVLALGIPFELAGSVLAVTISHALAAVTLTAWAARRIRDRPDDGEPRQLRRAISFGLKGYAANALQFLNQRIDLFIVSAAVGSAAVGQLSVAIAVTSVMLLLPRALGDVLFPRVAALSAGGEAGLDSRAMVEAKSLRHVVLLVVITTLGVAGATLLLLVPVYGSDFRPAIELALILLPGFALLGISQVLWATIIGRGRPVYSLYGALVITPVTIGLYFALVPALDAEGAAIAKTASNALTLLLALIFYRRVTGAGVAGLLVPTRSELDDYMRLPRAVREWAAGLRSRS